MRAGTATRGEQLAAHGIVDDGVFQASADLAGDRDREYREAVEEIRGAVERVDDPDGLVLAAASALLGQERVRGVVAADAGDDLLLGGLVDLGDEVVAPLGVDGERFEAVQAAHDQLAGAARGAHGNVEKRLHGH